MLLLLRSARNRVDDSQAHQDIEGVIYFADVSDHIDPGGSYKALASRQQCTNLGICDALHVNPSIVGGSQIYLRLAKALNLYPALVQ